MEPETRRSYRTSVRQFYAWATDAGHVTASPAEKLPRVRPSTPNPHPASERAYTAALATADPRERLMLRLAAELGLRRGEVARVHSRDVLDDDGGWSLLVHGKGNRDRVLPYQTGSQPPYDPAPPAGPSRATTAGTCPHSGPANSSRPCSRRA